MTSPHWNGDKLDKLRVLAAHPDKLYAGDIAKQFGVSKNAIIGACRRNGITLQRKSSRGVKRGFNGRKPVARGWKRTFKFNHAKEIPFETALADVVPLNIPMADLQDHECRYPYGEWPYLFCGNPTTGDHSYCPQHHRLCWVRPPNFTPKYQIKRKAA